MALKSGAIFLMAVVAMVGCVHISANSNVTDHPIQYIVVLDASASRSADTLKEDQDFVRQISKRLSFGDRITLVQMQQEGLRDHAQPWSTTMPQRQDANFQSRRDTEALASKQNGIALVTGGFFKKAQAGKVVHTDIFATLHIVGEIEQAAGERKIELLILSDMLQSTKGVEMEHAAIMPRKDWLNKQKHMGALPHLDGTCVVVVGADASDGAGIKVRNFWEEYFKASGATLKTQDYLFLPPPQDRPICR
jgi:hypothetical protein